MTIASEITRLQNAKSSIRTAIQSKWVSVPTSAKLDSYYTYINQIKSSAWCVSASCLELWRADCSNYERCWWSSSWVILWMAKPNWWAFAVEKWNIYTSSSTWNNITTWDYSPWVWTSITPHYTMQSDNYNWIWWDAYRCDNWREFYIRAYDYWRCTCSYCNYIVRDCSYDLYHIDTSVPCLSKVWRWDCHLRCCKATWHWEETENTDSCRAFLSSAFPISIDSVQSYSWYTNPLALSTDRCISILKVK